MRKLRPYIVSLIVVAILAWYYFISRGFPVNIGFIGSVTAFSATFLIGFSFILGPIARFIPGFAKLLVDRKAYGLAGYALAGLHAFLSGFNLLNEAGAVTFADVGSLAFAAIAFMIFTLMALTSTNKWLDALGEKNWKNLQRTGYLAFAFVLMHIILIKQGVFLARTTGQIAIALILAVLFLRALALVLGIPSREKVKL